MQISKDNINFKSRNITIQLADDIARKVNNVFPRVSATNLSRISNAIDYDNALARLDEKIYNLRDTRAIRFLFGGFTYCQKIRALLEPIKKAKVGNCGEATHLAAVCAKMNGVNDMFPAYLTNKDMLPLDHEALYVLNKGKPYIIDSWLGFADYLPNALQRYAGEYKSKLNIYGISAKDLRFAVPNRSPYDVLLSKELSLGQKRKLEKIYPELLLKKGK